MNWNLLVAGPAQKQLRRIPRKDRGRVEAALLAIEDEPFSGDLVRLHAQPAAWRRRVGSYRILFDVDYERRYVVVSAIVRRTSATY
jgi:mRNA-degrading endonuclease RelE of RelBE toxin-antitoxin system